MTIRGFTFNPFQTNAFVAHDQGEAALIDFASYTEDEHRQVLDYLDQEGLEVKRLLLTHGHIDHIFGCQFMADHFGLPIEMHRADRPLLDRALDQAKMFGVDLVPPPTPENWLSESDEIVIGSSAWRVIETPGHSPGSVSFVCDEERVVIAGDVLFNGSIGRTDLWQGSLPVLMRSIFDKLVPLGDDVRVYCGHGPDTTIGQEVQSNPFLT
jgi:hydroxyacylglutathione hydrolase